MENTLHDLKLLIFLRKEHRKSAFPPFFLWLTRDTACLSPNQASVSDTQAL